jgi:hypothetical protein
MLVTCGTNIVNSQQQQQQQKDFSDKYMAKQRKPTFTSTQKILHLGHLFRKAHYL